MYIMNIKTDYVDYHCVCKSIIECIKYIKLVSVPYENINDICIHNIEEKD